MRDYENYLLSLGPEKAKPGLARMRSLLEELGNPQHEIKAVHISGTNGKGSTLNFLKEMLLAAGYSVGAYTSPHLFRLSERITINNREISDKDFNETVRDVREVVEKVESDPGNGKLTYFEVVTACAFLYFARKQPDICLIEVGIEGRFDATNVFTPLVTVITNIKKEHEEYLGDDIEGIAAEAVGIIRPGVPVVSAEEEPGLIKILETRCAGTSSRLCLLEWDFKVDKAETSEESQSFTYLGLDVAYKKLEIKLLGSHQLKNAACALAATELLEGQGFKVGEKAARKGLEKTRWLGRFQKVSDNPPVIIDGAHNPAGMKILNEALKSIYKSRPVILILGMSSDKDIGSIINELPGEIAHIITTRSGNERAMEPSGLAELLASKGYQTGAAPGIKEAVELARLKCPGNGVVVVAGSLYLAADALRFFGQE